MGMDLYEYQTYDPGDEEGGRPPKGGWVNIETGAVYPGTPPNTNIGGTAESVQRLGAYGGFDGTIQPDGQPHWTAAELQRQNEITGRREAANKEMTRAGWTAVASAALPVAGNYLSGAAGAGAAGSGTGMGGLAGEVSAEEIAAANAAGGFGGAPYVGAGAGAGTMAGTAGTAAAGAGAGAAGTAAAGAAAAGSGAWTWKDILSAATGAVGAATGVANAVKSGHTADAAQSAANAQQDAASRQLQIMQDQWDTYKKTFLPVAQRLADTAMNTPVNPDYATVERMAGEGVKQQGAIGWQNYNRQAQDTRGAAWNPGSDNYQSALRNWSNQTAGQGAIAKQIAHTSEKNRVEDLNWNRMAQVYGMGEGIPGSAAAIGGSAGSQYGSAANTNMNLANTQAQNAAMGFYGAGRAIQNWNQPAATASTPAANAVSNGAKITGAGADPTLAYNGEWGGWRDGGPVRAIRMDDGGVVPPGFSVDPLEGEDQRRFAIWMVGPAGAEAGAGGAMNMSTMMPGQGAIMRHPTQDSAYFADGGAIRGSGSGTSDSIPTKLPPGAYVVPADVVRAKGTDFFDKMHDTDVPAEFHTGALGGGVSAKVSDGEYLVAPQVVRSKGQEFFDKLIERYHTPVKKPGSGALPDSIEKAIRSHRPTAAIGRH